MKKRDQRLPFNYSTSCTFLLLCVIQPQLVQYLNLVGSLSNNKHVMAIMENISSEEFARCRPYPGEPPDHILYSADPDLYQQ